MIIKYFGHSFLLVESEDYTIALDPYGDIGLIPPTVDADYVFSSHSHYDHDNLSAANDAELVENSNGCFTIIPTFHDNEKGRLRGKNNILLFKSGGYTLAFMGDFGEDNNEEVIKALYGVDILFIPVGGTYTIDSKTAKYYVDKIQPQTVIPIHYKINGCSVEIDKVDEFLKLFDDYIKVDSPFRYKKQKGVVVIEPNLKEYL